MYYQVNTTFLKIIFTMSYKRIGEIWLAEFVFEDNPNIKKKRPVLILENGFASVFSAKITSHSPRQNALGEYEIIKWKEAGLLFQSTIRLSKIIRIQDADFYQKLGNLQEVDLLNVLKIIKTMNN